jgi:uncharacterized membrane protein YjgN (DUF898 family)
MVTSHTSHGSDRESSMDISAPPRSRLDIAFTGSGSEYFRISIVNLLLTALTLGFYIPFAKARRLRYFHENTLVGGAALSFHGDPWRMLRGYLLIGLLVLAYSVLTHLWPLGAALMLLVTVPLGPLMLWSALRFRLGQTAWRGLRLRFDGRLDDAYRVFWPALLPLGVLVIGQAVLAPGSAEAELPADGAASRPVLAVLVGLCTLALGLMTPWISWRLKVYQHGHYRLGDEVTQLDVTFGSFYRIHLGLAGIGLLVGLVAIGVLGALVGTRSFVAMMVAGPLFYIGGGALLGGFLISRMQNLVWSRTSSAHVQFRSELGLWPLVRLLLKNTVLTMLTLGLYWPFAAIALARLRLAAVSIELNLPVEQITGTAGADGHGAAGEAAADLNPLGFDIDF